MTEQHQRTRTHLGDMHFNAVRRDKLVLYFQSTLPMQTENNNVRLRDQPRDGRG